MGKGSNKGVKRLLLTSKSPIHLAVMIVFSFAHHVPASQHVLFSEDSMKTLKHPRKGVQLIK